MADFSFLSDSDDDRAVNELLSQAMDEVVLEQVAAINCSGFSDSVLPTHLESRFQKLKSFPTSNAKQQEEEPSSRSVGHPAASPPPVSKRSKEAKSVTDDSDPDSGNNSRCTSGISETKRFGSKSSGLLIEDGDFAHSRGSPGGGDKQLNAFDYSTLYPVKKNPVVKKERQVQSSSPPLRSGCFWCSPKKGGAKRGVLNVGLEWERSDELKMFSERKARKEEEKISREADKIVEWVKQASARLEMEGYCIKDEELSDNESL